MNGAAEASIEPTAAAAEPRAERPPDAAASPRRWSAAERIGFRLFAVYFVIYAFPFPLDALPWLGDYAERGVGWVWKQAAQWIGAHLLGITEMRLEFTGSGDTTDDYVRLLLTLVLAVLSSHLLLMAVVMLWVERERLLAVCWRHCSLPAVSEQALFRGPRGRAAPPPPQRCCSSARCSSPARTRRSPATGCTATGARGRRCGASTMSSAS